jgi:cell division ATPase FtsA
MIEIAEQVFEAPARLGYPERDRFGGLIEDVQSPAWAAAAGLALVAYRAQSLEYRALAAKRMPVGKITGLMAKVRERFSGIF